MAGTAGSVAPVFRDGGYDNTVIYDFYHALIHNNKLYFCRQDGTIGHEPQEETDEYWFLSLDGNFGDAKKLGGETAAQWQTKIDVEKERIDQIVAMEESTGGNVESEVLDIRIGADGITYDSAGTAVREQLTTRNVKTTKITEVPDVKMPLDEVLEAIEAKGAETLESIPADYTALSNEVESVKSDLSKLDNLLSEDVLSVINENTPTTLLSGKIIDTTGNLTDYATWKTMYFTATEDFQMYVDNFTPNYFRIGVYNGGINSENLISIYFKNIDDGTNTLPTIDNKADVNTGNIIVLSMTSGTASFEIFKLSRDLLYKPKKMYYSKSENVFDIYIPSKTSDNFIHYVYKHDIDESINLDTWRFYTYEIVDKSFNRLYGCSQTAPAIEMDSVVKETDSVDFMGGYHGDENMVSLSVLVDGKVIDVTEEIPLTEFYKEIRFCGTSIIDKCNVPNDNMFTRYKTNVFGLDGYYSKQRWVALQDCNLQLAYMGMMSLPVVDNDITMVTTARMDNNYIEQNFHETAVENGAKYPSKDAREVEIYGDKLYGKAKFFTDNYDSTYRAFCDDSQNNIFKAYFRVGVGVSTIYTGEELRGEMHVEFLY